MVKPLTFKGDKKPAHKKRKREHAAGDEAESSSSRQRLAQQPAADIAGEAAAEDDSSWVSADAPSDVAGPVMLVLCSESGIGATAAPPVALTCDALGGVFATRVENLVDGNVGASAEPHETRQVWVARRVVGADGWTFKGYEGK